MNFVDTLGDEQADNVNTQLIKQIAYAIRLRDLVFDFIYFQFDNFLDSLHIIFYAEVSQ